MHPTATGANPYAPPKAQVSDVAAGAQPLWNANAAASWRLLFSPAFGVFATDAKVADALSRAVGFACLLIGYFLIAVAIGIVIGLARA